AVIGRIHREPGAGQSVDDGAVPARVLADAMEQLDHCARGSRPRMHVVDDRDAVLVGVLALRRRHGVKSRGPAPPRRPEGDAPGPGASPGSVQAAVRVSDSTYALPAAAIVATTSSGCETLMACDAPAISRTVWAPARSAPARSTAAGMLRSSSPNTCQDGVSFQAGRAVGSPSDSAASVTGRCVAPMTRACASGTSAANWCANTSWRIANSLPPVLTGYATRASPRVL